MPFTGPVAYQPQSDSFTDVVISSGLVHVPPSSELWQIKTRRLSRMAFALICFSFIAPPFQHVSSQMIPVVRSTTGVGFPQVFSASDQMSCCALQVLPPSVERFNNVSISPESPR